jgi:cytochrome c5
MTRSFRFFKFAALSACLAHALCMSVLAQTAPAPAKTAAPATAASAASAKQQADQDHAEHVFQANCSRCHNPPDSLNPRVTGTIIRHMRVRANLSAADEQAILRFLNP